MAREHPVPYPVPGELVRLTPAAMTCVQGGEGGSLLVGPGKPKPLFEVRLQAIGFRSRYQVAANGQKFLVAVPMESTQSPPITVVTNWTSGLKH